MRYFKRYWDEARGDSHKDWGPSWWYFETNDSGIVERQIEIYDNGPTLRYSDAHSDDDFGGLADKRLDLDDFARHQIARDEFEQAWCQAREAER